MTKAKKEAAAEMVADQVAAPIPAEDTAPAPALLDAAQLRKDIAEIEGGNSDLSREALLDGIRISNGRAEEGADGLWTIALDGIEVAAPTAKVALDLWCSKARRAVLSGEAV